MVGHAGQRLARRRHPGRPGACLASLDHRPRPAAVVCARASGVRPRGDPNLGNCLWDGRRVALVDFEYAGWTDRAFELGDLVEHPQSHATPDKAWDRFVDGFDLHDHERSRYTAARRLLCFFWLARWWPFTDQPATTDRFTAQAHRAEQLLANLL